MPVIRDLPSFVRLKIHPGKEVCCAYKGIIVKLK
jgi:hypothetical protein